MLTVHNAWRAAALTIGMLLNTTSYAQQSTIAAASDLQFALEEVKTQFNVDTGKQVQIVYGSSGNFFRQISEGAPFHMYLSADESYVQQLYQAGLTVDEGILYALGRLVIMAPHGSSLKVDPNLDGLRSALEQNSVRRFAIANPEHAPYGLKAVEALRHAGLWEALEGKIIMGENVSQAAQFATSGNAQGGIIAYSLAISPNVSRLGEYAVIPQEWHAPLRQRMVLLPSAGADVQAFYSYLQEAPAKAIMARYGFTLPQAD